MPLISVIIPVYNASETVLETIGSVQRQSLTDFELIVIDDGSTDDTLELLERVGDRRLRVFRYENGGPSAARNRGISHARGEFISFIDADDLWVPDKLELQLAALRRHPKAGVAYSWTAFIDKDGRFLFAKEPLWFEGNVFPELVVNNFIGSGSNVLMRTQCVESVGRFDSRFSHGEDWDYLLRAAVRWPFVVVPAYQVMYRLSAESRSSTVARMEQGMRAVLESAFGTAPPELQRHKNESLAAVEQYVAFLYLARTPVPDLRGVGRKLRDAVHLHPRTLFTRKTQHLLWTWLLLQLVPPRLAPRAVRGLLRLYGRCMMLTKAELRGGPIPRGL